VQQGEKLVYLFRAKMILSSTGVIERQISDFSDIFNVNIDVVVRADVEKFVAI
jgi:hypothetical protein